MLLKTMLTNVNKDPLYSQLETISNKDLLKQCRTESMATILMRRHWRWIGHVTRQEASITMSDHPTLDARGKVKERPPEDQVAADSGEGHEADGKDLEQHSSHGKGPADVEGLRCCPTRHPA